MSSFTLAESCDGYVVEGAISLFLFGVLRTGRNCLIVGASGQEEDFDSEYWAYVDEVFADLSEEDGEEIGNNFWIGTPPEGASNHKLVMQTRGSTRIVARTVRALLLEDEASFVGGKLLVNGDVLVVLYLRDRVQLDEDEQNALGNWCDTASTSKGFNEEISHLNQLVQLSVRSH